MEPFFFATKTTGAANGDSHFSIIFLSSNLIHYEKNFFVSDNRYGDIDIGTLSVSLLILYVQ